MRENVVAYVEALERRDWEAVGDLLSPDVVYEMPQTRERVTGRDAYVRFNREYPGDWHLRIDEAYADRSGGVAKVTATLGGEESPGIAFFRFGPDGLIAGVTDYWPEPYDPPPGREHLVDQD